MCKGEDTTGPGPQHTTPGSSTCILCEWHYITERARGTGQYWAVKNPQWPRRNLRGEQKCLEGISIAICLGI